MGLSCPSCNAEISGWVPEDRLKKATADKREATTKAAELAEQLEGLTAKAGDSEALQAELDKVRASLEAATTGHARQIDVMSHGITDPDDVADLLAIYERRAPEGVGVGDWLSAKDSLPRSVSALLSVNTPAPASAQVAAPTEAAPVPEQKAAPTPAPIPSSNNGAVPTPPAQAMPSASEIGQMTTEQYKAQRDRILSGLTNGA